MKRIERHKLKENEFARTVARTREVLIARQREVSALLVLVVVVLVALGAYTWWRQHRQAQAEEQLARGLAVHEAPIVALPPPAPGSPPPIQQPGTYPTEQARAEAALPLFLEAAESHPATSAGIAARYHAAALLLSLGRPGEAEPHFQYVVDRAGDGIYSRTARLGLAEVQAAQGNFDAAIQIYREMSAEADSPLPVDSLLMQLGRTYLRAGRPSEAAQTFRRIVDEFPQSLYAADARREMEEAQKG